MTLHQRQEQLIQQIKTINDEQVLIMLEEELSYHQQNKTDVTDDLTPYEFNELVTLANESNEQNTISLNEFRKATERWRTK